jgi:hypothetical protein
MYTDTLDPVQVFLATCDAGVPSARWYKNRQLSHAEEIATIR